MKKPNLNKMNSGRPPNMKRNFAICHLVYSGKMTCGETAKQYGITRSAISRVLNRNWKAYFQSLKK